MNPSPTVGAAGKPMPDRRALAVAVETFRTHTKRDRFIAGLSFVCVALNALQLYRHGISTKIAGDDVLLVDGAWNLASAILFLVIGLTAIWTSPADRLLLLMAEDALAKNDDANRLAESTSTPPRASAELEPSRRY